MRTKILNIIDHLANIKWEMIFCIKILTQKEFRNDMYFNKKFKNSNKNNRCFIVGNGPSLKKLDLSRLKDEVVFTVNEIISDQRIYEQLKSDFHIIIDPNYYHLNENSIEDKATIELFRKINYKDKKPVCIIGSEGKVAFKRYGLDKELDLHYIYQHKYITENFRSRISMAKNLPASQNVIQAAIYSAIYMGFKDIYLIGVDMTSVFLTYEASEDGEFSIRNNTHVYNYSNNHLESIKNICTKIDNEYTLYDYAKTFTLFKRIRKYAEKNNININNATKGGGLDVFQRIKYESLFIDSNESL